MGPGKHEETTTFRWSFGKTDTRFSILICALSKMGASDLYEQLFLPVIKNVAYKLAIRINVDGITLLRALGGRNREQDFVKHERAVHGQL